MKEVMGIVFVVIVLLSAGLACAESIFLSDYLEEGETTAYESEDGVYVISLLSVSDATEKAVFRLNDEMSKGIRLKDSYVFEDGSEIVLRDLLINDAQDTNDEAYYYFYGTGKSVLELRNVSRYVLENNLCNFDTQCLNESKEDCCYDCGCNEGAECLNNKCSSIEEDNEGETEEEAAGDSPAKGGSEALSGEETEEKDLVNLSIDTEKDSKERKVAYVLLVFMALAIVLVAVCFIFKKRRRRPFI
ncbi:hypothetical protein KY358_02505 [Candidatus Woesearchaeota archaeon]|nr:hypothetical protein [Candidatus Woesearchaeota archaeon]